MSEGDLGKELLRLTGGEPGKKDAARAIARCRRTATILAGAAIGLWALVAAGLFGAAWFFDVYILPVLVHLASEKEISRELVGRIAVASAYFTIYAAGILAVLILLAGVATVAFVLASRRATLRQIQASLAELVEELRRPGGASSGDSPPARPPAPPGA